MRPHGWARLALAALLCAVSLGLAWGASAARAGTLTPGYLMPTTEYNYYTGDLEYGSTYIPGTYIPGDADATIPGSDSDVRIVIVPAVLVLAWAASRRTRASRRATRAVIVALAVVTLVGFSRGMASGAMCTAAAAWLAATVAWPGMVTRLTGRGRRLAEQVQAPPAGYVGPF